MQPVIVALDFAEPADAQRFLARLSPGQCRVKVGKELFVRGGPAFVESLVEAGWEVFLDLKFHDIPNTVAAACRAAASLGVWMVNVHALGGSAMLSAARDALHASAKPPLLTAVTVLTSHDEHTLAEIGVQGPVSEAVLRLARIAEAAGLDGVVCSGREAGLLREAMPDEFRLVTPGIRPTGSDPGDQKRVLTPADALAAGATDLVIGRPVTRAVDPAAVLAAIQNEMQITASGAARR